MNYTDLAGKIVLITGGSRGIGKEIVKYFAESGAHVFATYATSHDEARDIQAEYESQLKDVTFIKCDVRSRGDIRSVMALIEQKFGRLDVLVNNAGINNPTNFDEITDEDWDNIMAVNLRGPFICSQEALRLMVNSGSIVHISSVSGQYGGPRTAHYAASKAGLISLGQVIARFGAAQGVRSNSVAAGLINSEMASKGAQNAAVRKASENIVLARFGEFAEVANVVGFLASDASSYITAQTLNVNGGLYF